MSEGLITIAYGPQKYIRMARALALSYRRHLPKRPFAVVTDQSSAKELGTCFDVVIPITLAYGSGVVQKLYADIYSPFDKTLFVDSDCIFYKSPERIWDLYAGKPFSMRGWRYLTGSTDYEKQHPYEFVQNTSDFLKANNISRLPLFNSGVFFFSRSETASRVFHKARAIYEKRATLGFVPFKNAPIADEPAFAVAMESCGVEMDPWDRNNGMETAINMENVFSINVLNEQSRFLKNGTECDPVLIHFNVGAQDGATYYREMCRLQFEKLWFRSLCIRTAVANRMFSLLIQRTHRFVTHIPTRVKEKGITGVLPNRFIRRI